MAFSDYELIHTKRVNRQRKGTNIYSQRFFNSMGGWNTLFFAGSLGFAGYQLRQVLRKSNHFIIINYLYQSIDDL